MSALLQRAGWSLSDQALSSISNFALSIVAAHALTAHEFGAFGIAFSCYLLALGVCRSLCGETFVVRFASKASGDQVEASRGSLAAALGIGVTTAGIITLAGLALGGELRVALLAIAVVVPGLLLQDTWRYVFFGRSTPEHASLIDLTWLAVQIVGFAALFASHRATLSGLTIVWGVGAVASVGTAAWITRMSLRPRMGLAWLRDHRDLGMPLLGDFLMQIGSQQLAVFGLATIVSVSAVGTLRATSVALGPVTMLSISVGLFTLPEASRARQTSLLRVVRVGLAHGLAIAVTAAAGVAAALLLPNHLGLALLGERWKDARPLIPFVGLQLATSGLLSGGAMCLRVLERAATLFTIRLVFAPVVLVAGLLGARLGGLAGMMLALSAVNVVSAVGLWFAVRRAIHADSRVITFENVPGRVAVRSAET